LSGSPEEQTQEEQTQSQRQAIKIVAKLFVMSFVTKSFLLFSQEPGWKIGRLSLFRQAVSRLLQPGFPGRSFMSPANR
jgi:hypothetical protein